MPAPTRPPTRHHHFETGTYKPSGLFLPDDEYGRALDALVKGCVDCLLTNEKGEVLLGLRKHEPAKGTWWYIGGRMRPGETVEETARRHAKRDIGIEIDTERFRFVTTSTMNWEFRVQEPAANGTCDINVVLAATLTEEEIARKTMCADEYLDQKFWSVEDILAVTDEKVILPPIHISAKKMVWSEREDAMYAAVARGADDAEIARLARRAYEFA